MPKAPPACHSKWAGKEHLASSDAPPWARWKAGNTTDNGDNIASGNAGYWSKYDSAATAWAQHEDVHTTDQPQDNTKQPTTRDEEDSELELMADKIRVKKKVFRAVSRVIEWGFALDHRRTTIGLAQIDPDKALSILRNIHTVVAEDPQQYVDRCVAEVIAKHGDNQVLPRPRHVKHIHWTAQLISRQLVNFVRYPTTLPPGLHVYKQDMLRREDVMTWWGTREGLTTTEVIEAIKEHSMDQVKKRFTLLAEPHRTMLVVHKNNAIGQATHKAFQQKTKQRKSSQGKKKRK